MRKLSFKWPVVAVMLLAGLCAGGRAAAVDEEALPVGDLHAEGMQLFAQQQYEAALPLLIAALEEGGEPQAVFRSRQALARIYLSQQRYDAVLEELGMIPREARNPQSRLLEGLALIGIDLPADGLAVLEGVDTASLTPSDNLLYYRGLAEGNAGTGNTLQALWFAHQGMMLATPDQAGELFAVADRILAEQLPPEQLPEVRFMFSGKPIGAAAGMLQVRNDLAAGDRTRAVQTIAGINVGLIPPPYQGDAIRLYTELTGNNWLQRAVGVVLPLSGRFAVYGELVRRGMELARVTAEGSPGEVRFIYRDGKADAEQSRLAVETLSRTDKVLAVSGLITGAAAELAASQAQLEQVPMMSLSPRSGLPETGPYVFRNSLTSRMQAEALARYAVEVKGMTSFGVLYPDNRLGREMLALFSEEVGKLNGLVIAVESYAEDANDFGRQIRLLKGEDPYLGEVELDEEELLEDLFVPDFPPVAFDALFIPDYADRIGLIAPQLAYYGIEEVPLLGINGWNSPDLLRLAGPYVDGAVFVDAFFSYSSYPFVREFVDRYYEKYGEEPTILEAQGYDVAGILLSLLDDPAINSRNDLRLALSQLRNFPGVTGATSFNLIGEAEKVLYLLQIENGNIVQVEWPEIDVEAGDEAGEEAADGSISPVAPEPSSLLDPQ